jgi:putative tributyrin esterase
MSTHRRCGGTIRFSMIVVILFFPAIATFQTPDATQHRAANESQPIVKDAIFFSKSLQREMHYRVLLPADYQSSAKRYPTLFLLHGLYGDFTNWTMMTHLAKWSKNLDLIIAMPDAGNSWYVNSATTEADKFEEYIVEDFVLEIDSHFRTVRERPARAIAGLSMGGYAAVNFSVKHPTLFSYAGAVSAALDAPLELDERIPEFKANLQKAFGPRGSPVRSANDIFLLVQTSEKDALPYFYVDCGEGDFFLTVNRTLAAKLQEKKIRYEYHEFPGAHEWAYWDAAIRRFLVVLTEKEFASPTH